MRRINLDRRERPDRDIWAWLEANGINPENVPARQHVLIIDQRIVFIEFLLDDNGHKIYDQHVGFKKQANMVPLLAAPDNYRL